MRVLGQEVNSAWKWRRPSSPAVEAPALYAALYEGEGNYDVFRVSLSTIGDIRRTLPRDFGPTKRGSHLCFGLDIERLVTVVRVFGRSLESCTLCN